MGRLLVGRNSFLGFYDFDLNKKGFEAPPILVIKNRKFLPRDDPFNAQCGLSYRRRSFELSSNYHIFMRFYNLPRCLAR